MGWTTPAWSTAVSQFSLYATRHVVLPPHSPPPATGSRSRHRRQNYFTEAIDG